MDILAIATSDGISDQHLSKSCYPSIEIVKTASIAAKLPVASIRKIAFFPNPVLDC
jgi:hypothetical protein